MRSLQRAVLLEVAEDGANRVGFFDAGHDPYRTAAVDAGAHVDIEDALEALRPTHRAALRLGRALLVVPVDLRRHCIRGRPLAAPRWRQLRSGSVASAPTYSYPLKLKEEAGSEHC